MLASVMRRIKGCCYPHVWDLAHHRLLAVYLNQVAVLPDSGRLMVKALDFESKQSKLEP